MNDPRQYRRHRAGAPWPLAERRRDRAWLCWRWFHGRGFLPPQVLDRIADRTDMIVSATAPGFLLLHFGVAPREAMTGLALPAHAWTTVPSTLKWSEDASPLACGRPISVARTRAATSPSSNRSQFSEKPHRLVAWRQSPDASEWRVGPQPRLDAHIAKTTTWCARPIRANQPPQRRN